MRRRTDASDEPSTRDQVGRRVARVAAGRASADRRERQRVRVARPARRPSGRAQPDVLAVISLGGMLGASARYGIAQWLPTGTDRFPWATFWTNLSGCFVLGLLLVLLLERFPPTRLVRPFLATGIIGAFTTMSTYEVETALLIKDGHAATGVMYGVGSMIAGLALAYLGIHVGRFARPRHPEAHR